MEEDNKDMLIMLNSVLRVYCSNFSVLHWNSAGEEFNDAHRNIAEEYEELCHKYVDVTAEMATRLGSNPLNYLEVIELMQKCEKDYVVIDSKRLYTRKDIIAMADKMFADICDILVATLEWEPMKAGINAGIKAELETILNDFDLQYRYINKRRLITPTPTPEEI